MTREGIPSAGLAMLYEPTPPDEIRHRQGPRKHSGDCPKFGACPQAHLMLDYIDARYVMDRLDYLGPENWQDRYVDRPGGSVRCGIGLLVDGDWVWKWDVGTQSDIEPEKGSYSEAFKRAAVKWGIGRDLYGKGTTAPPPAQRAPAPPAARPAPASDPDEPPFAGFEHDELTFSELAESGRVQDKDDYCPDNRLAWALQPAGANKTTGKAYGAFWKCASDERPWCTSKPSKAWVARHELDQ